MDTAKVSRLAVWPLALSAAGVWMLAGGLLWQRWHTAPPSPLPAPHRKGPAGIVVHHTVTPPILNGKPVDVRVIDAMHARRGFRVVDKDGTVYHIAYHYLVLQNGTVQHGRPEHLPGAHTKGHPNMLGIALVGDFQRSSNRGRHGPLTPPPAQMAATIRLTRALMAEYGIDERQVFLHRDLCATACPGDGFSRARFMAGIAQPLRQARQAP